MAIVKPFRGLRPPCTMAKDLACLPYDVMSTDEARIMAQGKECSLLHITRAEIDLPDDVDSHSDVVYDLSVSNFKKWQKKGWLIQDKKPGYYIYAQTMHGRTQYGLVGCASVDDYLNGIIKKHELTRPDKEDDRMIHVRTNNANMEPVFFAYPAVKEIDEIVKKIVETENPEYDFVAEDGFGHQFWLIDKKETIDLLGKLFKEKVPYTYVADGHHRTAAAALLEKSCVTKIQNIPEKKNIISFLLFIFLIINLKLLIITGL